MVSDKKPHVAYLDIDELHIISTTLEWVMLCARHQANVIAQVPLPVAVSHRGYLILLILV